MEDYRTFIRNRWGSYKALSIDSGSHISTIARNLAGHEAGNKKATKRLQAIVEQAENHRKILTRKDFRLKMEALELTYEALAIRCQKYLPHVKGSRLRHYINSLSATKPTCPTYQALKKALYD